MPTVKTEVQGLNINSRTEVAIEGPLPRLQSLVPILSCVLPMYHYFSLLCLLSFYNALLNPHRKDHFPFQDLSFFHHMLGQMLFEVLLSSVFLYFTKKATPHKQILSQLTFEVYSNHASLNGKPQK